MAVYLKNDYVVATDSHPTVNHSGTIQHDSPERTQRLR